MAEINGITFTTKEMLLQLDGKIDTINYKLDKKVDRDAFEKVYTKLEQAADRAAVSALEAKVSALATQIQTQDSVNAALAKKAIEIQQKSASNFTRGEKVVAALLGISALIVQLAVYFGGS